MLSAVSALPLFCSALPGSSAGSSGFAPSSTVSALVLVAPLLSLVLLLSFLRCLGLSATSSVLLSQCLVTVLLSLCSWLLVQSLPVLRPWFLRLLFLTSDCLRSRWCLAYIDRYLVALLPLAAGFSQAPLPPCFLFVEFLLLLLLLVIMSFCLGLSVYAPHSVAPACSVSLLASGLPGSSLLPPRLPPCSVGAVLLGSAAPVASSWLARFGIRFPGLSVSVGGLVALVPVARGPCGLFVVFCLVGCSISACFCLALQVPFLLFILLDPDLSLSLGSSCSSPLAPGAVPCWLRCLSLLPS